MATSQQSQKDPEFPWESSILTGPFWDPLTTPKGPSADYMRGVAHAFPQIFTPTEISEMLLDPDATKGAKLTILSHILNSKLTTLQRDVTAVDLPETGWANWRRCHYCLATIAAARGDLERSIAIHQHMDAEAARRDPSKPDSSSAHNIAWALKALGRNAEAEAAAWQALPFLQSRGDLGPDSPQVLGTMRLLMEVIAKQGRESEAMELNGKGWEVIELLKKGKFRKYQQEEIEAMQEVKESIPKWAKEGKNDA